jgi:dolichyl-phosphate-mannose-protein mannosyltransferase
MSTISRLTMFSQVLGGSFAAMALFGIFWMNINGGARLIPAFAIVSAATLMVARLKGDAVLAVSSRVRRALPDAPSAVWLFAAVVLGIILRILLAMLFPAIPQGNWNADMIRYWDLAHRLVDGVEYATREGQAYWPPGLPLTLAVLLPVFGSSAALAYNIITFVVAEIATFALGRILGGWRIGCLAAFFLAIWPNYVFAAPLLNKECLLIALWPAIAYFYLKAHEVLADKKGSIYALVAGALVGYSALTQPAMLLLPVCLVLFSIFTNGWRRRTFICVLAAACGVVAVVMPWMVRNYVIFHHFVPIGSAGGQSFFLVTRPYSDGGFNYRAAVEWFTLSDDEVVRNQLGFSLGIKSIRDHPFHFLSTVVRKPFYLYGQDIRNIYWNLYHVEGETDTREEHAAYLISNGFYLGVIVLISMMVLRKQYVQDATAALVLLWMFTLYPIFAHSVFEGAERHRHAALSFMAIFAAMALCRPGTENSASGGVTAGSPDHPIREGSR